MAIALAIALAGGVTVGSADSLSLKPTDQSDVSEQSKDANYSDNKYSRVGYSVGDAESLDDQGSIDDRITWITYLKFHLPVPSDDGTADFTE